VPSGSIQRRSFRVRMPVFSLGELLCPPGAAPAKG
jgi:hypothetical protein